MTANNPMSFTDVSGVYNATTKLIFAVGTNGNVGYLSTTSNGTSWSAPTQLLGTGAGGLPATALNGVFVLDATHAWAVGTSGMGPMAVGTVWAWNGTTWDGGTTIAGTSSLTNVRASDATDVWAAGITTAPLQPGHGGLQQRNRLDQPDDISGAKTLSGLYTADSTDIWVVGQPTTGGPGAIWYCNGAVDCSNGSGTNGWTTTGETVPTGTQPLNDISGFDAQPGDVYTVGNNGTLLEFNPSSTDRLYVGRHEPVPGRDPGWPRVQRQRPQPPVGAPHTGWQFHAIQQQRLELSGHPGPERVGHRHG